METGHTPNHTDFLAALQNCAIAYDQAGNAAAAMATRRIEIEVMGVLQPMHEAAQS